MSKKYTYDKRETVAVRMSADDKAKIEAKAEHLGFGNLSDYIRVVALNADLKVGLDK
jgi:uncharacterized protein (DUF1778 family)